MLLVKLLLVVAVATLLGAGAVVMRRPKVRGPRWVPTAARQAARLLAVDRGAGIMHHLAIERGRVDRVSGFDAWAREVGVGEEELPRLRAWIDRWSR